MFGFAVINSSTVISASRVFILPESRPSLTTNLQHTTGLYFGTFTSYIVEQYKSPLHWCQKWDSDFNTCFKYDTMSPRKRKADLEREIRELKAELSIAKKQIGEPNDIDNDNDASENTEWRDENEVSIHTGVKVQLPPQEPYNGTGRSWESFISSFRNLAATCGWEESEQRVRLLACLRGDAADFVFQQLAPDDIADFGNLISALEHRFAARKTPSTFVSQLELRRLGQKESIADYAADIRRLTTFGYPTADAATREMIGTRHFLRGLGDSPMAMAIGMREPATLQEAREIAERFHHLQEESGRGARHSVIIARHP